MKKEVQAALITGICGLVGAVFTYFAGANSVDVDNKVNQEVQVIANGYEAAIDYVVEDNEKKDREIEELNSSIQRLQEELASLQETIVFLELENDKLKNYNNMYNSEEDQKPAESIPETEPTSEVEPTTATETTSETKPIPNNAIPVLKAHEWKNVSAYKEFSGDGNNGFNMYGETYTKGFTIEMSASYNMWGDGQQYAIYNIKNIGNNYSILKLLVGHVDGYDSSDIKVSIYLDKTLDDNPDYEYIINPATPPQEILISVVGKTGMLIEVNNLGGSTNKIGFANPSVE